MQYSQADYANEELDYYDEHDERIGTASDRIVHEQGYINRHVAFYIINTHNQLLLQLRASDRRLNPNQWDKLGGHVSTGEDYSPRELREEILKGIDGVTIKIVPKTLFYKECANTDTTQTIVLTELAYDRNIPAKRTLRDGTTTIEQIHCKSYVGRYDGPINHEVEETQQLRWMTLEELKKNIKAHPEQFTFDLKTMITRKEKEIFNF